MSDEVNYYSHRLAVDFSTGNIYYTAVSYMETNNTYQSYIGVILPNGKHKTIITGLSNPQGVALHESKG
ncbi:hypothetical protein ACJMK2_039027, partial [Sinanodonta woodiana]